MVLCIHIVWAPFLSTTIWASQTNHANVSTAGLQPSPGQTSYHPPCFTGTGHDPWQRHSVSLLPRPSAQLLSLPPSPPPPPPPPPGHSNTEILQSTHSTEGAPYQSIEDGVQKELQMSLEWPLPESLRHHRELRGGWGGGGGGGGRGEENISALNFMYSSLL